MDNDDIELGFSGIIKQLAEDRTAGNGFDVSGLTLFAVDTYGFPAAVLADFIEEAFLGIQRMPFYL
jgi:hypothetical protein